MNFHVHLLDVRFNMIDQSWHLLTSDINGLHSLCQLLLLYPVSNNIAKEEMAIRAKLLEHVAQRVLDRIFNEISMVEEAEVSVAKINPPIGGNVGEVVIKLSEIRKN